jgi:cobalt-zinc-cadmium efflux system outer membrane protein
MRTFWNKATAIAFTGASMAWSGGLGLDSLLRMALARNADLESGRLQLATLIQDTLAASAPANPSLGLEAFHNLSDLGQPKASVRLTREFRPGYRSRAADEAKARVNAGKAWQSARDLDVLESLRGEYAGWAIAGRKAALQADAADRWEALSRLAATKVAEGRISQLDEVQIKLNLYRTRQRVAELKAELAAGEKRIGYLAGTYPLPDSLRSEITDSLPGLPARDSLTAWAMQSNPDIAALDREIAAAQARLVFEENSKSQGFSLSAGYDRETDGANLIGAGVDIPLPLFNRNQAGLAKARAGQREAEGKRRAAELKLRLEISELADRLVSLGNRYRTYQQDAQALVRKQASLSEKGFREGLLNVFDLSRIEADALDRDMEALDLLEAFQRTWIRLGRLVGGRTW